jgi:hypothetical protein
VAYGRQCGKERAATGKRKPLMLEVGLVKRDAANQRQQYCLIGDYRNHQWSGIWQGLIGRMQRLDSNHIRWRIEREIIGGRGLLCSAGVVR